MSREALAIGSDTKPPVLFRGEYSQWKDRFMDFVDKQELGDLMLISYKEGPGTYIAPTTPPASPLNSDLQSASSSDSSSQILFLKDKPRKTIEDERRVKADKLARSHLLLGLTNDIYTQVDSYKDAKSMWDEIAKQMQGSRLSSRAKITNVLTQYESFKALEGELLLDTYNRYCLLLNDLRRNSISKSNLEINIKFLKNLQPEWKRHSMSVIQNKDLTEQDIHDVFESLNLNQDTVLEKKGDVKTIDSSKQDPLALLVEKHSKNSSSSRQSSGEKSSVQVQSSDSDSDGDEVMKAMALLTQAMQRKFYKKPSNNAQRTSSFTKRSDYQSKPSFMSKTGSPVSKSESAQSVFSSEKDKRACFNCNKVGHVAKDCRAPRARNSTYYKNKMLLAKQEESGAALLADDEDWLKLTDDEAEDLELNMCFMTKITKAHHDEDTDAPTPSDSEDEVLGCSTVSKNGGEK